MIEFLESVKALGDQLNLLKRWGRGFIQLSKQDQIDNNLKLDAAFDLIQEVLNDLEAVKND